MKFFTLYPHKLIKKLVHCCVILSAALLLLNVSGCGQKGQLYLPQAEPVPTSDNDEGYSERNAFQKRTLQE